MAICRYLRAINSNQNVLFSLTQMVVNTLYQLRSVFIKNLEPGEIITLNCYIIARNSQTKLKLKLEMLFVNTS